MDNLALPPPYPAPERRESLEAAQPELSQVEEEGEAVAEEVVVPQVVIPARRRFRISDTEELEDP